MRQSRQPTSRFSRWFGRLETRSERSPGLRSRPPARRQPGFERRRTGGWPNNEAWISSNTVIERVNFVTSALAHAESLPSAADAARHQLDGVVGKQTAGLLNQAADERSRWFITLASPEFQLK